MNFIDNFYKKQIEVVKSQNARVYHVLSQMTLEEFLSSCNSEEKIAGIRNIGTSSIQTISSLYKTIKDFSEKIQTNSHNDNIIELINIDFALSNPIKENIHRCINCNGHFPMIYLLEENCRQLFNSTRYNILRQRLSIFNSTTRKTYEEIGKSMNLTRERVRQLEEKQKRTIKEDIILLQNDFRDLWQYIINTVENPQCICNEELQLIISNEDSIITTPFLLSILGYIFRDNYVIINDLFSKNYDEKQNSFLIAKDYEKEATKVIKDIEEEINKKNKLYLTIDIESIINSISNIHKEELSKIVRHYLECDFKKKNINAHFENNIVHFKPAKNDLDVETFLYNILENSKEDMDITELFYELEKEYPHKYPTQESLRRFLIKSKRISYRQFGQNTKYNIAERITYVDFVEAMKDFLVEPHTMPEILEFLKCHNLTCGHKCVRTRLVQEKELFELNQNGEWILKK